MVAEKKESFDPSKSGPVGFEWSTPLQKWSLVSAALALVILLVGGYVVGKLIAAGEFGFAAAFIPFAMAALMVSLKKSGQLKWGYLRVKE